MTFEDDYIQVISRKGPIRIACSEIGLDWPPPEILEIEGLRFRQVRRSSITDDQRQGLTHVCRGAEYLLDDLRDA